MAERRTRPTSADRRLIADRSAKSLRLLATPLRVYRDRSGGHGTLAGRTVNLTEYLTAPPDEMEMEEDDDEFENVLGSAASAVEGARVNWEMHDAFGGSSHRWSSHPGLAMLRRTHPGQTRAVASSSSDETQVAPETHSPPLPNRSAPWSIPTNSGLFRHSTMRRPVRSRTVDFNDFTSRRRSSIRHSSIQETPFLRAGSATGEPGTSVLPWEPQSVQEPSSSSRGPQTARRFFGLMPSGGPENPSGESADDVSYLAIDPNVNPRLSNPPPPSSSLSQFEPENGEDPAQETVPRLRRGGVRAPESILSRHASPTPEEVINLSPPVIVSFLASSEDGHGGGNTETLSSTT